ncbi:MAG TPA: hypothetical protein VFL82_06980 [Thermomicrobiales bacterium]|nr:hypothetical protein [Thermomicrobiales bacterium]
MLPTHQHVATHDGFQIYLRQPGFEFTPVMLGKIASFVVRGRDGATAACAFMYSLLITLDGAAIDEGELLSVAVAMIKDQIDASRISDKRDLTFEYRDGAFHPVTSPRWWIPTWG